MYRCINMVVIDLQVYQYGYNWCTGVSYGSIGWHTAIKVYNKLHVRNFTGTLSTKQYIHLHQSRNGPTFFQTLMMLIVKYGLGSSNASFNLYT